MPVPIAGRGNLTSRSGNSCNDRLWRKAAVEMVDLAGSRWLDPVQTSS